MLGSEGNVEHIHSHLDVLVDGQAVPVPANIGIDLKHGTISPLHTHDAIGIIHIESPVKRQFSLSGKVVRVFVNGTPQTGNPAAIMLGAHDEIALVYGTPDPGETIPSAYKFPEGDSRGRRAATSLVALPP
jgi:hypothetical protein